METEFASPTEGKEQIETQSPLSTTVKQTTLTSVQTDEGNGTSEVMETTGPATGNQK